MTISARLKEERQRLGLSQTAFAEIGGATKSAQVKWERGDSAPTAPALAAWAEAGADALYILTGQRTADRPDNAVSRIEDDLAAIRRDMLEPTRHIEPGEDRESVEKAKLAASAKQLKAILSFDNPFMNSDLRSQAESLLTLLKSPAQLASYRAADHVQRRSRRAAAKEEIWGWLEGGAYCPSETVANLLATLATEYSVPIRLVVEVVQEMHDDYTRKLDRWGGMEPVR